jgi:hypothetical protein
MTTAGDGAPPLVDGAPLIYFHHAGLRVYQLTRIALLLAHWTDPMRIATGPVDVAFVLPHESPSAIIELLWRRYLAALTRALGELAAANAPEGLFLDAPSLRLTGRHVARRRLPAVFLNAYRRLPLEQRHRISRWLASS